MLVYEKTLKKPVAVAQHNVETHETQLILKEFSDYTPYISPNIFREVLTDNELFMFERCIYSLEFFNFFTETVQNAVKQGVDLTIPATKFTTEVVAHAFNNRMLPDLTRTLSSFFAQYTDSCEQLFEQYLSQELEPVFKLLFNCSEKSTRRTMSNLLCDGLKVLAQKDFSENSTARRVINGLLSTIPDTCSKFWTRFDHFWYLLYDFYKSDLKFLNQFMEIDGPTIIADFYLGPDSPLAHPSEDRKALGTKLWHPPFEGLVQLLGHIVE